MARRIGINFIGIFALALLLGGCAEGHGEQPQLLTIATASPSPTPVTLQLRAATSTAIPVPPTLPPDITTPQPTSLPTPTPTETPAPTDTPEPTERPTATPKRTSKPTATPQTTKKPTPTPKPTAAPTNAPVNPPLNAPAGAPIITPAPTDTPAPTSAPTPEPTPSQTVNVPSGARYSGEDVLLAARLAYFEARRNEESQRAVLCVIANRCESSRFPNSMHDVAYQANQFSVVKKDNFLTTTIPDSVIGYANDVLNSGTRALPADVLFFRTARDDKSWGDTRVFYASIGGNDFYY